MTAGHDQDWVPARRRRTSTPSDDLDADVLRGQTAAVLAVMGRLQLRLDVLAREQAAAFERLDERLNVLESLLTDRPDTPPVD